MGAKMAPSYANLFVGYIEVQISSLFTGPTLELYGPYIGHYIGVMSLSHEHLDSFLPFLQSFCPVFKFSCTISNTSVPFLDILVNIHHSVLTTSIYYKYTDSYSYLNRSSFSSHNLPTSNSPSSVASFSVCAVSAARAIALILILNSWFTSSSYVVIPSPLSTQLLLEHFR